MNIKIGQIIRNYCKDNRISLITVASDMKLTPASVYNYLNRGDMLVSRLSQLSDAIGHNFFAYFVDPTGLDAQKVTKLNGEIRKLSAKVASQQKEIQYLQEINLLLKAQRQP
jgi:transcriptional regulator with XRE-family HTH domain